MTFFLRSLGCASALAAVSALAACTATVSPGETSQGDAGAHPAPGDDAGADTNPAGTGELLQGPTIGTGVTPNAQLRRKVPVTLLDGSDGFEAVDGYVFRQSAAYGDSESTAIRIKNTSGKVQCFVEATSYAVKGAAGIALFTGSINRVVGFSGHADGAGRTYGDCLEPGGVGAFFDIQTTVRADDVASYELQITGSDITSRPAARMVAQSFTVAPSPIGQDVTVTATNAGTGPAVIPGLVPAFVLDDDLAPLQWMFFNLKDTAVSVAPGASAVLTGSILFEGTSTHLLVAVPTRDP